MHTRKSTQVNFKTSYIINKVRALKPDNIEDFRPLKPENIESFCQTRFVYTHPIHSVCLVSGSTYEKSSDKHLMTPHGVLLDASKMTPHVMDNGVCTGFTMATADGYGHDKPLKIAQAAIEACDKFSRIASSSQQNDHASIASTIAAAGQSSRPNSSEAAAGQSSRPNSSDEVIGSSLAGTIVQQAKGTQTFSCEIGNVGDGMVVVLEANTRRVKAVIGARRHYCGSFFNGSPRLLTPKECQVVVNFETERSDDKVVFFPIAVQKPERAIEVETMQLEPHDMVIHMTDGIWQELEHTTVYFKRMSEVEGAAAEVVKPVASQDKNNEDKQDEPKEYVLYREYKIEREVFEEILAAVPVDQWNAFKISQAILKAALTARATRRSKCLPLLNDLERAKQAEEQEEKTRRMIEHVNNKMKKTSSTAATEKNDFDQYAKEIQQAREEIEDIAGNVQVNALLDEKNTHYDEIMANDLREFIRHNPALGSLPSEKQLIGHVIQELKKELVQSGDCATIAVAEVPDMAVEHLRPFFERISLRIKLTGKYVIPEESVRALQEARTAWANKRENQHSDPKTVEKKFNHFLIQQLKEEKAGKDLHAFYTSKEIGILTSDLINAYIAIAKEENIALCKNGGIKQEKQQVLTGFLHNSCQTIQAKEMFFNFLKTNSLYNAHRNKKLDAFFGLHNTKSWRETVKNIRKNAFLELQRECDAIEHADKKIIFLQKARYMKIFSEHRNNSIFFGAFFRTRTQKDIDRLIDQKRKEKIDGFKVMANGV